MYTWHPAHPVDLRATLSPLIRGREDPCWRWVGDELWWATGTPLGPALLQLRARPTDQAVLSQAFGAGRDWLLAGVQELVGAADDPSGFRPRPEHPLLVQAWRSRPGFRVPRSRRVFDALAAAAVEQVVTGKESRRAWVRLVRGYGDPAPGKPAEAGGPAAGMRLPPTAQQWRSVPSWAWLRLGVGEHRRATVLAAARAAPALERTITMQPQQVEAALRSLPGVGVWTAAEVRQRAHGDADAFSFADFHVAKDVSWALTGHVHDDDACAKMLAPYAGHRYRVQRLLELNGIGRPRRGPRMTLPTHLPTGNQHPPRWG